MNDTKTIFAMRKAGRLDEALPLAQALIRQSPSDPWSVRALGWVLCDLIKRDLAAGGLDSAREYLSELESLAVPDDDELLSQFRTRYRDRLSPCAELFQRAKQASQQGDHDAAANLYREALQLQPDSPDANRGLGWAIVRRLQAMAKEEAPDGRVVRDLLLEYSRLKHLEIPGTLHSFVLREATALQKSLQKYIGFVRWWNPTNLRPEDYEQYKPEGGDKSFDSLVEQVIKALYRAACDSKTDADIEWAIGFIGAHYPRYPEQAWFPYYYGKLLVGRGRKDEAQRLILPIVREKQSEFWAWEVLANTFEPEALAERCACLCRALLCKVKEEPLRVNVHAELGEVLLACGELAAARREFDEAARIRQEQGWKLPPAIQQQQNEAWYRDTEPSESNMALYQSHATEAVDLLTADIPWSDAVVTGIKPENETGPELGFLGFRSGGDVVQIPTRPDRFPCLQQVERGAPVRIKLGVHGDRQTVVAVEPREGGQLWDVLPVRIGVATHVNAEKQVTHIALGRKEFELLHHDRFPEAAALIPGDFVAARLLFDKKQDKHRVVSWQKTDKAPGSDFCRSFQGAFRLCNSGSFGFVGDIYVHRRLIDAGELADGQAVAGTAVCEWNEKKGEYTWSAVTGVGGGSEQ